MPNVISPLPSIKWLPQIHNLCYKFLKEVSKLPGGRFLVFHDYLGGIRKLW